MEIQKIRLHVDVDQEMQLKDVQVTCGMLQTFEF